MYLTPVVEAVAYAGLAVTVPLVLPDVDRISPADAAARVPRDVPVRLLAGGADRRATPDDARAILARLGPAADLVVIDGGDHLALDRADPVRYRAAVREFLAARRGR
jgi:pimeloyl-ACP methyl ester carboxylesterase